jgi:hypothetical protein
MAVGAVRLASAILCSPFKDAPACTSQYDPKLSPFRNPFTFMRQFFFFFYTSIASSVRAADTGTSQPMPKQTLAEAIAAATKGDDPATIRKLCLDASCRTIAVEVCRLP